MPAERRELVAHAIETHELSERRSCRLLEVNRAGYRYEHKTPNDEPIQCELQDLAKARPRWGAQKMIDHLKNQGHNWNHKRIYRVYCELGLN